MILHKLISAISVTHRFLQKLISAISVKHRLLQKLISAISVKKQVFAEIDFCYFCKTQVSQKLISAISVKHRVLQKLISDMPAQNRMCGPPGPRPVRPPARAARAARAPVPSPDPGPCGPPGPRPGQGGPSPEARRDAQCVESQRMVACEVKRARVAAREAGNIYNI